MKRIESPGLLVDLLGPGKTAVLHSGCAEPPWFARELARHAQALKGTSVVAFMPMGHAPYADEGAAEHLDVICLFPGKGLRHALTKGRVRSVRRSLYGDTQLFASGEIRADVVMLQVSPPGPDGCVSLGIALDYVAEVLKQKPIILAQINPRMPRTAGDTLLPVSAIDYYVESENELQEIPPVPADAVDERIARRVASLIEDGMVIEMGIGSLPDCVLGQLGHLRHLGLHTGTVSDALIPLIESGAIDNSTKKHMPGRGITAMAGGTRRLYDFLGASKAIEIQPSTIVHNPDIIATQDGFCAINSALQVDLMGNVNGESVAGRRISMPGGMPDFSEGACRSKGGISIIALRSTAMGASNIVRSLGSDVPVTITGDFVDYLVTEHGIARVRGASADARAKAILAIADPALRETLG